MAQIIPFPVKRRDSLAGTLPSVPSRPSLTHVEAIPSGDAASSAEALPVVEPVLVRVPPKPLTGWQMMGCAVFAVFGAGILVVLMALLVTDPLEGDSLGDDTGSKSAAPSGGDLLGPAWFSTGRR